MSTIVIDLTEEIRRRLDEQARRVGKPPEVFTREVLESALHPHEQTLKTTREILEATGRARPLSETLRRKIISGVTLDEVRMALSKASGPSLSEIIIGQRGAKL